MLLAHQHTTGKLKVHNVILCTMQFDRIKRQNAVHDVIELSKRIIYCHGFMGTFKAVAQISE